MAQGMVDGLGGEEINQVGPTSSQINVTGSIYTTSNISGVNIYATTSVHSATFSGTNIYAQTAVTADNITGDTKISGAAVYSAGAVTGSEINNADGLLSMVNGGVVACAAGSSGTIEFATNFPDTTWSIGFATSGAAPSATLPTVSGTLNVSGALIIGAASTSYYYTAVRY